ncbi:MGH1-like glycoside hydrolase domain-containing protein [Nocardioides sp.]|uniref:MGH1-like glycoside hydrolase domain-containing protein n=1 Tax=Nocardioides sp. TaxID=35761 RepID=UPI003784B144
MTPPPTAEHRRLAEATGRAEDGLFHANPWYEWGPYLAERAWGTVREDYSSDGDAWSSFPHDHARSRAFRWNEDGMAGISDIRHELCLALALWNGRDPILKERMFGLTGPQGNHGEDAKEYWWYLEGLPSHALLQWRYHYPQAEFPYQELVEENARRGLGDLEHELVDTGVFDDGRFWGVDVTYAKASPTDIAMCIDVTNHGPDEATLHVLPTLWFRNTWRWSGRTDLPDLSLSGGAVVVDHPRLGGYRLQAADAPDGTRPEALFCDNETNMPRLYDAPPLTDHPKDGINDHVVSGAATVAPDGHGTKAAFWYRLTVPAGETRQVRLRLHRPAAPAAWDDVAVDRVLAERRADADEFYGAIGADLDEERMRVLRQASAGLVWSKQMYPYRVSRWLDGDPAGPPPPESHRHGRNAGWRHLDSFDVLAMPDPWEYPWFAAWDLAFHAISWAHLDPAFAKYQLSVLLREWFQHPNGALPAYEWNFDDVNPPVHALAALRVFVIDGARDVAFLERIFQKLLVNFTWWLNREDPEGHNLFGGGFLGLDNISPVDRSHLPDGIRIEQADGTAWMAQYSLVMLVLALVLAAENPVYDDMVVKFLEQFLLISDALESSGLYDEDDGFFYDRLVDAAGNRTPIKVQTLVGVIPVLATASVPLDQIERLAALRKRFARRLDGAERAAGPVLPVTGRDGTQRAVVALVKPEQALRTFERLFDEEGFLSPHGLRSVSRRHVQPYSVPGLPDAVIDYEPAESTTPMYGGNSNWRGPVWMPTNYLVVRSLLLYDEFLGEDFTVEYPTGSGTRLTVREVASDLADRLVGIWLPDEHGRRPVHGDQPLLADDPAWRDNLLFFEYFHGDVGAGLGASHQTGWTALVVDLLLDPPARAHRLFDVRR